MSVRVLFALSLLSAAMPASAAPQSILLQHQGFLIGPDDAPVDVATPLTVKLWKSAESSGDPDLAWEQAYEGVTFSKGRYAILLGDQNVAGRKALPASVFSQEIYLGITLGSGVELRPRLHIGLVPSAVRALTLDCEGCVTDTQIADASIPASKLKGGTGSGLDADKLDGLDSAVFLQKPTVGEATEANFLRGDGRWATPPAYTLPAAGTSTLGGVKAGSGVNVAGDGTLSVTPYTLPTASTSAIGGVKGGGNVAIDANGTLSVTPYTLPVATASALGGVKGGGNVAIAADGTLSYPPYTLPPATATALGGVKAGAGHTIAADGLFSLAPATASGIGGVKPGTGLSVASDGTLSVVRNRQFGRFDGNGSSGGDGTAFVLTSAGRTRGSGIIRANQLSNAALRNEFEALVGCWFTFTASISGNSSHGYTSVRLTKAAGGTEELGVNLWHESSTMGYSYSGSTFLSAGDKVSFYDDYTPSQPTSSYFYFTAEAD